MDKYFRTTYLSILAFAAVFLAYVQRESIFGTDPTSVDLLILGTAIACLFFPVVKEISLGGVTLKRELDNTKKEITEKLSQIRNEIVSSVAVSPTFNVSTQPLNDEALARLEASLEQTVNRAFQAISPEALPEVSEIVVENDTLFLFSARHNIERELRRIWGNRDFKDSRWPSTVHYMTRRLAEAEIIPQDFVGAIKEVYNVCSPAIHGEEVTQPQVAFVHDLAPKIVATLRSIN